MLAVIWRRMPHAVFSDLGRFLIPQVDMVQSAGNHKIEWRVEGLPSGVYFYRLHAGDFLETKALVLLR